MSDCESRQGQRKPSGSDLKIKVSAIKGRPPESGTEWNLPRPGIDIASEAWPQTLGGFRTFCLWMALWLLASPTPRY